MKKEHKELIEKLSYEDRFPITQENVSEEELRILSEIFLGGINETEVREAMRKGIDRREKEHSPIDDKEGLIKEMNKISRGRG